MNAKEKSRVLLVDAMDGHSHKEYIENDVPNVEVVLCHGTEEAEALIRSGEKFDAIMARKNNPYTRDSGYREHNAGFGLLHKIRSGELGAAAKETPLAIMSSAKGFALITEGFAPDKAMIENFRQRIKAMPEVNCLDPNVVGETSEYVRDVISKDATRDWKMKWPETEVAESSGLSL